MHNYECSFDVGHNKHNETITANNENNAKKCISDKYPDQHITWHYCKLIKEEKKSKGDK